MKRQTPAGVAEEITKLNAVRGSSWTRMKVVLTEVMDVIFFQEIGCSRKVAITGARKLDMLVCRHSWEKCRGVWVCWEPR